MRSEVSVRSIITRGDQVLLIHRIKNGEEYWVVPGGGVEVGEEIEEALIREIGEETSRLVTRFEKIGEFDEAGRHQVIFTAEIEEGEVVMVGPEKENECEDNRYLLEWININDVGKLRAVYPKQCVDYLR